MSVAEEKIMQPKLCSMREVRSNFWFAVAVAPSHIAQRMRTATPQHKGQCSLSPRSLLIAFVHLFLLLYLSGHSMLESTAMRNAQASALA